MNARPAHIADAAAHGEEQAPFSSNAVRLSVREWVITALVVAASFGLIPAGWEAVEPLPEDADLRMPYALGNDYWLYGRFYRSAAEADKVLVVGDSVVWGQYVAKNETLSHYLDAKAEHVAFANLGLDGAHPAALAGLLRHYARNVGSPTRVVLCLNALWMTSKRHDLQTEKEFRFNHPRLVNQFDPALQCYTATTEERLSVAMERSFSLFSWANHLQQAYLGSRSFIDWTYEHPYRNPLAAMWPNLPMPSKPHDDEPKPWTQRGMNRADFPWVTLDQSYQWDAFQTAVRTLRRREDAVFVVFSPFNEHMLKGKSRQRYRLLRRGVEDWLAAQGVAHHACELLPSGLYADASHPLAKGYARIADALLADPSFRAFIGEPATPPPATTQLQPLSPE